MPRLLINRSKLSHNLRRIEDCCRSRGLEMAAVLKSAHVLPELLEVFRAASCDILAFSRINTVTENAGALNKNIVLIGLPPLSRVEDVVRLCSASFNSEISVIRSLAWMAKKNGVRHGVYLVVDVGDLREGVLPDRTLDTLREMVPYLDGSLRFLGLAANYGCASGTLPDYNNVMLLQRLVEEIESKLDMEVPGVSVGGTMVFHWMQNNELPPKINQIRIGEGILCGHVPGYDLKMEGLHDDVFLLQGEVLEVKEKVSPPPGERGLDAFGNEPRTGPAGKRKRALLDFGLVDTDRNGLIPCLKGLEVVTSSSEYTIADITGSRNRVRVGDYLDFRTDYAAMTRALESPFVEKVAVG